MRLPSVLAAMLCSALGGAVLVIACSDDSPGDADAAVCDCPAAEPPVAGRIQWVTVDVTVNAMAAESANANCPPGAKLLGGGCGRNGVLGVDVYSAWPFDFGDVESFVCEWRSNRTDAAMQTATAICLLPPT